MDWPVSIFFATLHMDTDPEMQAGADMEAELDAEAEADMEQYFSLPHPF
jgi:hypothetical protein